MLALPQLSATLLFWGLKNTAAAAAAAAMMTYVEALEGLAICIELVVVKLDKLLWIEGKAVRKAKSSCDKSRTPGGREGRVGARRVRTGNVFKVCKGSVSSDATELVYAAGQTYCWPPS